MKKLLILVVLIFVFCNVNWATDISLQWTDTLTISDTGVIDTTTKTSTRYRIFSYPPTPIKYIYPSVSIRKIDTVQVNRDVNMDIVIETSIDDSLWSPWDSLQVNNANITTDSIIHFGVRIALTDTTTAFTNLNRANYVRLRVVKWCTYLGADTLLLAERYDFDIRLWLTGRY